MPNISTKPLSRGRVKEGPGRPQVLSAMERCRRILKAAEQVFTAAGYGAATMDEVARVAGMSKKTIYGLFPDKEHLFAALISDAEAFPGSKSQARLATSDPVEKLREHLLSLIEFVLSPRQVEMTRLLIAEARHSPKLADEFYARVMRKGLAYLTEGVAHALKAQGITKAGNVDAIAMALFGAALGGLHLAALFGKQKGVPRKQLIAHIDLAIALMLPNLPRDDSTP